MVIRHVFVYGTLLSDMDNYHVIRPYATSIVTGKITGRLVHLCYGYPALLPGDKDTTVLGEIVEIDDMKKALPMLDRLEDYYGQDHPANLYNREVCVARGMDDAEVTAYVYTWAKPELLPEIGTPVEDGDWRRFMARRQEYNGRCWK